MKKVILFLFLTVILSILIFIVYNFYNYTINYKFKEIPFYTNLSFYEETIKTKILKNLGYKVKIKIFPYNAKKNNVVFVENLEDEKTINKWEKWITKDRIAIFFYDRIKNTDSTSDIEPNYIKKLEYNYNQCYFKIKKMNNYFDDVNMMYLSDDLYLNPDDNEIFKQKIVPLLTINGKIKIGFENIKGGKFIFIADKYIFSNRSILVADNAIFLNNILKNKFNEDIIFDYNYFEKTDNFKNKPPYFMYTGVFKFILMQIILLMIIFFLVFCKRYGNVIDKKKFERRSIIYHLEAVGYFFEKEKYGLVVSRILDNYFFHKLKNIIKIKEGNKNDIINETKKKYNIKKDEEIIFNINDTNNLIKKEIEREKFLQKLKKG